MTLPNSTTLLARKFITQFWVVNRSHGYAQEANYDVGEIETHGHDPEQWQPSVHCTRRAHGGGCASGSRFLQTFG